MKYEFNSKEHLFIMMGLHCYKDGMKNGYDIELLQDLSNVCKIPMIASGGAGSTKDFVDVFTNTNVDGALAASIFHNNEYSINQVKTSLKGNKINVRI